LEILLAFHWLKYVKKTFASVLFQHTADTLPLVLDRSCGSLRAACKGTITPNLHILMLDENRRIFVDQFACFFLNTSAATFTHSQ
jgi:hypothetical protein